MPHGKTVIFLHIPKTAGRLITSRNMSLEDFVGTQANKIYNHQTRMLAALDGRFRPEYVEDEVGEEELARAPSQPDLRCQGGRTHGTFRRIPDPLPQGIRVG